MSLYIVRVSDKKSKKFSVEHGGKRMYFGDSRYDDYLTHKDKNRKRMYLRRAGEYPTDPSRARYWSRWVLWNKPDLEASIADIRRRFGLNVVFVR